MPEVGGDGGNRCFYSTGIEVVVHFIEAEEVGDITGEVVGEFFNEVFFSDIDSCLDITGDDIGEELGDDVIFLCAENDVRESTVGEVFIEEFFDGCCFFFCWFF